MTLKNLLAEARSYIKFGLRARAAARAGGDAATVEYWTGYVFAMRTLEASMERAITAPETAQAQTKEE